MDSLRNLAQPGIPLLGGWDFMRYGELRSRVRGGKIEWWIELDWNNQRHTLTQLPVAGPNGTEWCSCSGSKAAAEFLLNIVRGRIKDHCFNPQEFRKQSPMQFDSYAGRWLTLKKSDVGKGQYHILRWAIENYLKPHFKTTFLPHITKTRLKEIQSGLKSVRKKNAKGSRLPLDVKSKKNVMDVLSQMLRDACPDYIQAVPEFPGFTGNNTLIPPDIRVPPMPAILDIMNKIALPDRLIFLFMLFSGCRPSEARAFRKEDVRDGHLMFVKTFDRADELVPVKGKKPKPGPLTNALKSVLAAVPLNVIPQVFANPRTGKHYTRHALNALWRKALRDSETGYLKLYDCTRHAYATHLRMGGMALEDIRDLLRHTDLRMTARYDHSDVVRLAPRVDNILRFPGKSVGKFVGKLLANDNEASK